MICRRGGVAGNITFGMGLLGLSPVLVGAAGEDWADYRSWLERHGVDCDHVRVSETAHTARFVCTTDRDLAQIATFYPGAMSEARDIELGPIVGAGGLDLVVVAPNDPQAMLRHAQECRDRGLAFAADPSQQLAFMEGPDIRRVVEGAAYLFTNEYESHLIEAKTGWGADELAQRVGVRVTTRGKDGATITRPGSEPIHVQAVTTENVADPTGVGDAFRSGYLAGLTWGLSDERCAQIGATLATFVLETVGTQEYEDALPVFGDRLRATYGDAAADEIAAHLPPRLVGA